MPVPLALLSHLEATHGLTAALADAERRNARLWPWGRAKAWTVVKRVMKRAGIAGAFAKPKALRHGFGVEAVQLNMVQRWMGTAPVTSANAKADVDSSAFQRGTEEALEVEFAGEAGRPLW